MMNEMELPEWPDTVLEPVDGKSADQVEPEQTDEGADGGRECAEAWKESKLKPGGELAGTQENEGQRKIDKDGCQSKEQVDAGVPPLAVREVEERDGTLDQPEEGNASRENERPVSR
ncbi:MAG: hypothetical protein RIR52_1994 [Acidobacteriota bacterium]